MWRRRGFSLLEVVIALTIISLLIGSVLVGQHLLRGAEMRDATASIQAHLDAVASFQQKFNSLPGDLPEATNFWGAADAVHATCITTTGTGLLTCNGDANGKIITPGTVSTYYEAFRAWQHLANANMIGGKFTGLATAAGTLGGDVGINVPQLQHRNTGLGVRYLGTIDGADANYFSGDYGHIFTWGAEYSGDLPLGPGLAGEEAYNVDTKLDDGLPSTGWVRSLKNGATYTSNCASVAPAYSPTGTTLACSLVFITGF